jgi:hypothetical protein
MIQEFSAGYYLKTYWVQISNSVKTPQINKEEYEAFEQYGYENTPLIVKVKNHNFIVNGDKETPVQTLKLSSDDIEKDNFDRNPSKENVLMPKPAVINNFYL